MRNICLLHHKADYSQLRAKQIIILSDAKHIFELDYYTVWKLLINNLQIFFETLIFFIFSFFFDFDRDLYHFVSDNLLELKNLHDKHYFILLHHEFLRDLLFAEISRHVC